MTQHVMRRQIDMSELFGMAWVILHDDYLSKFIYCSGHFEQY